MEVYLVVIIYVVNLLFVNYNEKISTILMHSAEFDPARDKTSWPIWKNSDNLQGGRQIPYMYL